MELEGMKRCRSHLIDAGINVLSLTTDRHPSVQKWMREHWSEVQHFYDLWHISKCKWTEKLGWCVFHFILMHAWHLTLAVKKKLSALAKRRVAHQFLYSWIKSITNHLYWCVAKADGELRMARWKSVMNHLVNIHDHDSALYPKCLHGDIERNWIVRGRSFWLTYWFIYCIHGCLDVTPKKNSEAIRWAITWWTLNLALNITVASWDEFISHHTL